MEKILITGSSGYIGATVMHLFSQRGYAPEALSVRLEELKPGALDHDIIIHCAGALRHRTNQLAVSNMEGTDKLIRAISNPRCHIIHISSRAVYAPTDQLLSEDSPLRPLEDTTDAYGISKLSAENLIRHCGQSWSIIRPTNVYGLGVNNMSISFPAIALKNILENREVPLYLPDRLHDFLYVWDLAEMIWQVFRLSVSSERKDHLIVNAASDPESLHLFIGKLAQMAQETWGIKAHLVFREGPPARNAIMDNTFMKTLFPTFRFTPSDMVFQRMMDYLHLSR